MSALHLVGVALSTALFLYLLYAMLAPEKFS